jgi:hypothetical protein
MDPMMENYPMKAGWIAKSARVAMTGAALAMLAGALAAPASAQSNSAD